MYSSHAEPAVLSCPTRQRLTTEAYYDSNQTYDPYLVVNPPPSPLQSDYCGWTSSNYPLYMYPDSEGFPSAPAQLGDTKHEDVDRPVVPGLSPSGSRSPSPSGSAEGTVVGSPPTTIVDIEGEKYQWSPSNDQHIPLYTQSLTPYSYASPSSVDDTRPICRFGTNCGELIQDVSLRGVEQHIQQHHIDEDGFRIQYSESTTYLVCLWPTDRGRCQAMRDIVGLCEHIISTHLIDPNAEWLPYAPHESPVATVACEQLCRSPETYCSDLADIANEQCMA